MTPGPEILSVGRALPPSHVDQETLNAALSARWGEQRFYPARLAQVHRATRVGLELGEAAIREGLTRAGLAPRDVGLGCLAPLLGQPRSTRRSTTCRSERAAQGPPRAKFGSGG